MKEILKWLAAAGIGGLSAGLLAFLTALSVVPAGIDPFVAGLVIAGFAKLVSWLVSKLPVRA